MKRFKKELSWLLVTALVVSSLVVGLGQLTPKAATNMVGTGYFTVTVGVRGKSTACNGTTDQGSNSNLILYALTSGGAVVSQYTMSGAGSFLDAHDSSTREETSPDFSMTVNATIAKFKFQLSGGDNLKTDYLRVNYSYDGGTNYTQVAAQENDQDFNDGTEVESSATTHFSSTYKNTLTFNADGGSPTSVFDAIAGQTISSSQATTPSREGHTFTGWASVPARMPNNAATYYAGWTAKSYSITFNGNDATGGVPETITQNYGTAVTQPAAPYRTGYTFTGWSPACPSTMGTGTACVAQWSINSYTITWNANGGSGGGTNSCNHGATPTQISAGTKTGHSFSGWTPAIVPATGATTYTAQWAVDSYTITWDANGGTGGGTNSCDHGATPTAIDAGTKTGYTFTSWSPAIVAATGATTYTAQWTLNYYTVSFEPNGGSSVTAKTQLYGTSVTEPEAPIKTGNTFDGWYTDSGLTTAVTWSYTLGAADVTFYAKWTVNSYYITFDANGGTGGIAATLMQYGATLTAPTVTKTGSTFSGWSTTVPATVPAADTTYTAQWGLDSFAISFDSDGGSAVPSITQDYGTSVTAPANPTRDGYTFNGWSPAVPPVMPAENVECVAQWTLNTYTITWDANGGTGGGTDDVDHGTVPTPIDAGTKTGYTFTSWSPSIVAATEATTYTAQWTINSYDVIFDANTGTGTMSNQGITYNTSANLTANTFTQTGYAFTGWNTAADGSGTDYADEASYGPIGASDVTLYAQWEMDALELVPVAAPGITTIMTEPTVEAPIGFIYGLEQGLSAEDFEDYWVEIVGDGRIEITPYDEYGAFGTGTKVEFIDNADDTVVATYHIVIFGDVNGDGVANFIDADITYNVDNYIVEWDSETEPYLFTAGDTNGDASVNFIDGDIIYNSDNYLMYIDQTTGLAYEV